MKYQDAKYKMETAKNKDKGKPLANNTRLFQRGKTYAIQLHNTDVVTIDSKDVLTLNTGGWNTITTKDRMNNYINGARISSIKGIWHVLDRNFNIQSLYYDGIKINSAGLVVSKKIDNSKKLKETAKVKAKIKKYVDGYAKHIADGKLENPSGGDCFFCQGLVTDAYTRNTSVGVDHLNSHIEENYFVPSLLVNAIKSSGYNPSIWFMMILAQKDAKSAKRFLTKYLVKNLVK